MSRCVHADNKLAHYARACTDILFKFPFGTQVRYRFTRRASLFDVLSVSFSFCILLHLTLPYLS